MPFLLLLLLSLVTGAVATVAAYRLAPPQGATAAAAGAVTDALAHTRRGRRWMRSRVDPTVVTGLALTAAVVTTVVGGLVIALLAYLVRGNETLSSLDASAAEWGDEHATSLSTRLLQVVTDLGDWPALGIIAVAILAYELYRAPSRYLIPFTLVVIFGDQLVTNAIKDALDRARPTLNPIAESLGPSFPSGHSSTAAAFYAAMALILARRRGSRTRALLAGAAAGMAIAVAASRVLLDVHWLSDVIAGVALGWAWFALCAIAFGGRLLRFAAPLEPDESLEPDEPLEPDDEGAAKRPVPIGPHHV